MDLLGIGAIMGKVAPWGLLALAVCSGVWAYLRERGKRQALERDNETLRRALRIREEISRGDAASEMRLEASMAAIEAARKVGDAKEPKPMAPDGTVDLRDLR